MLAQPDEGSNANIFRECVEQKDYSKGKWQNMEKAQVEWERNVKELRAFLGSAQIRKYAELSKERSQITSGVALVDGRMENCCDKTYLTDHGCKSWRQH